VLNVWPRCHDSLRVASTVLLQAVSKRTDVPTKLGQTTCECVAIDIASSVQSRELDDLDSPPSLHSVLLHALDGMAWYGIAWQGIMMARRGQLVTFAQDIQAVDI
jgi:hypothetical protein